MDELTDQPRSFDRRIGRRIRVPNNASLSFVERRAFRRARRLTVDVDVIDVSITGIAVRVFGGLRFDAGSVIRLSFRGETGSAVVRHAGDPSPTGSRVYGLEVPEATGALSEAIRVAVGEARNGAPNTGG
jgi:hypothetical protein